MLSIRHAVTSMVICILCCSSALAAPLVFYTEDYAPFQKKDKNGKYIGFSIDILMAAKAYLDTEIHIEMVPWNRAYREAETTPNTFLFTLSKTPKRLEHFIWVDDFYQVQDSLYKRADREDIVINQLSDIHQYTLAIPRADVAIEQLNINQQNSANIFYVANQDLAFKMLSYGRVDLNYNNSVGFLDEAKSLGFSPQDFEQAFVVSTMDMGIAANKNSNPDIINKVKYALQLVKASGEYQAIVNKWFPN